MGLSSSEKSLLLEVLDKHIKFVESTHRTTTPLNKGQLKKKNHVASKLADLQNVRIKVEMFDAE